MAKDEKAKGTATTEKPAEIAKPSMAQLQTSMTDAVGKKDWKAVSAIAKQIAGLEAEKEKLEDEKKKAEREAKLAGLATATKNVAIAFNATVNGKAVQDAIKALGDVCEGVWFALDFGQPQEVGINPTVRLVKITKGAKGGAAKTGNGSGSYISRPEKTADLLAQVGDNVMFKADTAVTIDKKEVTIKAGTTFKEAHDFSDNGGWRNRVRMALLKEAGLV